MLKLGLAVLSGIIDEEHIVADFRQALSELPGNVKCVHALTDRFVAEGTNVFYRCSATQFVLKELLKIPVRDCELVFFSKQVLKCGPVWPKLVYRIEEVCIHVY